MSYRQKFDWVFNYGAVEYSLKTQPSEVMFYTSHKFKPTEVVINKATLEDGQDWKEIRQEICDAINLELQK